jgi:hypothetical protein
MGFGLVIGFIDNLQTITTSNYICFTNLPTSKFTMAGTKSSQSVFAGCCLVTKPNTADSSASVFTSLPAADCPIVPHDCTTSHLHTTQASLWPATYTATSMMRNFKINTNFFLRMRGEGRGLNLLLFHILCLKTLNIYTKFQ